MSKPIKVILCICAIILGWVVDAFAFTTTFDQTIRSVALVAGILLFLGGIIFLIVVLNSR